MPAAAGVAVVPTPTGLVSSGSLAYSLAGPISGPQPGDLEQIARRYLAETHGPVPGLAIAAATTLSPDLTLLSRSRSPRIGLTHLTFQQTLHRIPIFDGELQVHLDDQGRIWRAAPPAPRLSAHAGGDPKLTAHEALTAAVQMLAPGEDLPLTVIELESGPERRSVFASPALSAAAPVSLTWFHLVSEFLPAWQMYVDLGTHAYWVVIDARDGRLLYSHNLTRQERPTGLVYRAFDRTSPLDGPQTTEPWTGWPASHGDCPPEVYPPQFRSGPQGQRCWVRQQQTEGNNVDACLDLDGNNLCDARALASQDRFSFPFSNAFDQENDPARDRHAALANAFYWVNALHDWLYRLGFDEAAGNFQADNFGRGGAASDALRVDLQDPDAHNNATFTTPPDGIAPRMELGLFTGLRRDTAFDADILTHEYVHGLTTRLVGGPGSTNGLSLWQSGAMAEGWSDAYAASFTADPVIGEYASRNPATGIRTVAYDNSPHTFGMFGTLRPTVIPNSGGLLLGLPQVHRDGEIWATVLWELRRELGSDDFEQILTTALMLTPRRPSMLDARDAILQAAQAAGLGGGSNCRLWEVFAARGFGFSAGLNPVQSGQANDTALSVFESFDVPAGCGGSPPVPGSLLLEETAESANTNWVAAGQWHRSSRRAASGAFSWWYGREVDATYDTGARNKGSLTSAPIDLRESTGALLEWDQFLRTEGFNNPMDLDGRFGPYLNADSGRVMVSTDGGSSWRVLTHLAHPTPGDGFAHYRVNLTRFSGQTIRLQFDFDTFDSQENHHEGWFLDNIRVSRLGPEPARLHVDPVGVSFSAPAGGAPPAASTIRVAAAAERSGHLVWTASISAEAPWLSLLPASGQTPSEVQVSVVPVGLSPGVYHGEIRFYELNRAEAATTVDVTLTVEAPAGPLAAWSFDAEGRGPGVSVAGGPNAAYQALTVGGGTDTTSGVAGKARVFDGATAYAAVSASPDFTQPRLTLRTWVRLDDYPGTLGVIASALGGDTPQGWLAGVLGAGNVALMALSPDSELLWLVSRRALAPGEWHAVTATFDWLDGEAALYLDGELDISARFTSRKLEAPQPLTIGRASWWDGYYLAFAIDEMLLASGVWTAAEVRADFASFSPPPAAQPALAAAEWHFEEPLTGVGTTLADSSARGHDAVVQGEGSRVVPGIQGSARGFDPPGFARIAPHSDFASPGFSFSAWIQLDAYPSNWGIVFSNFDGDYRGWFSGVNNDGRVIFSLWGQPAFSSWVLSGRRLETGRWHHLAVSFDDLSQRAVIYIDGETDRSFTVGGFTPQTVAAPTFAHASWVEGYFLGCALDEARYFRKALPAYEIRREFERFRIESPPAAAAVNRR